MCFANIEQVDTGGECLHVSRNLFVSPFELEASDLFSESVVVCCSRWDSKSKFTSITCIFMSTNLHVMLVK